MSKIVVASVIIVFGILLVLILILFNKYKKIINEQQACIDFLEKEYNQLKIDYECEVLKNGRTKGN